MSTDVWTGASAAHGGNDNWSNAGNWSLGAAPGAADTASFTSSQYNAAVVNVAVTVANITIDGTWGGPIAVNNPVSVNGTFSEASGSFGGPAAVSVGGSFALSGGTFGGDGASTVGGAGDTWSGGNIYVGAGGFNFNAGTSHPLTLSNPNAVVLYGGGTFTDNGVINQTGAGGLGIGSPNNSTTTLVIPSGDSYNIAADSGLFRSGQGGTYQGIVNNAGTIAKTGGTGTSVVNITLNNTAAVTANSGTLALDMNVGDSFNGGTYTAAAGAYLDLTAGDSNASFNLSGTFTGAGSGTLLLNAGAVSVAQGGATMNIPSSLGFQWSGGAISVPVNATLTYNGTLTTTNVLNSPDVAFAGGGTVALSGTLDEHNSGNVRFNGTGTVATTLNIASGSKYLIDKSDADVWQGSGAGGVINNSGTIERTGSGDSSAGESVINVPLNNTGNLQVDNGTLYFEPGNLQSAGTFTALTGATLSFEVANYDDLTLNPGATFTGAGLFDIAPTYGGGVTLNTNISAANLQFDALQSDNAYINGSGNLTATKSFTWTGGSLGGTGVVTVASGGTLSLPNTQTVYLNQALNNAGTANWTGTANIQGSATGVFNNLAGATFNASNNQNFTNGGTFNNAGTFNKTSSVSTLGTYFGAGTNFNNSGAVNVTSGYLAIGGGSGVSAGSFAAAAGTTVYFEPDQYGSYTWNAGTTLTGAGLFDVTPNYAGGVTVNTNVSVANLEFDAPQSDNASISGSGNLTVTGGFTWTGGGLNGTGVVTIPAGATLSIPATQTVYLNQALNNAGTANWTGTGEIHASSTGVFNNLAGATFNAPSDQAFRNGGTFNNAGTFNKTSSVSTLGTYFGAGTNFNNSGAVNVTSGYLAIGGGSGVSTGSFAAAAGTTVYFEPDQYGSYTWNAGTTLTGAGLFDVTPNYSAGVTLGGNVSVPNLEFDAPQSDNAYISGPGNLTVTGGFTWTGGSLSGAGAVAVASGATMSLPNTQTVYLSQTLNNAGTANWTGTANIQGASTGVINNLAGGVFNAKADLTFTNGGTFNNSGTFNKTSPTGTGTSVFTGPFNNSGALNVNSGTVTLAAGGTESGSGSYNVASGAALDLDGGNSVNIGGTYSGTGAGHVYLNGGQLNLVSPSGVTFSFPSGLFQWDGGTINTNSETLTIAAKSVITVNGVGGEVLTGGGSLVLNGTVNQTAAGNLRIDNGTTLSIGKTGIYNLAYDSGIAQGYNAGGVVINAGTLEKTVGTNVSTVSTPLNNTGKVIVKTGTLNTSGSVNQVVGTTLSGGTWEATGSKTAHATLTLSGSPTLATIDVGTTVMLTGPNSAFTNLSALATNDGTLQLLGGQGLSTPGAFTNAGALTLSPGSVLAVGGSFTQTSAGSLAVQVGGTSSAPLIGQITVASGGTVTLGGTLTLTSTVVPTVGTVLTLLSNGGGSAVSGTFSGLPEGSTITVNGHKYQISYHGGTSGHDVTLTLIS